MNFAKGVLLGTIISAGAIMLYNETTRGDKKKMLKQGKKFMKNMGMM